MRRIVFWQNMVSLHQAPLVAAVAQVHPHADVVVVAEAGVSAARADQGWSTPSFGRAELLVAPPRRVRDALAADRGCVHVFSGLAAYPETHASFVRVAEHGGATVLVHTEPWQTGGPVGWARAARYRLLAARWRRRVSGVLATGAVAVDQYARAGFDRSTVFPFGYFVGAAAERARAAVGDPVRVAVVGAVSRLKRVDWVVRALAELAEGGVDWRLDVVGDGPETAAVRSLVSRHGLAGAVRWWGNQPNATTRDILSSTDVLVLASSYDGWGAVVNEALQSGALAVVSDAAGAADLVRAGGHGRVFAAASLPALTAALGECVDLVRRESGLRDRVRAWAERSIAPEAGAVYLTDIVAHLTGVGVPRPRPPWLS